jgi:hypothetical protein
METIFIELLVKLLPLVDFSSPQKVIERVFGILLLVGIFLVGKKIKEKKSAKEALKENLKAPSHSLQSEVFLHPVFIKHKKVSTMMNIYQMRIPHFKNSIVEIFERFCIENVKKLKNTDRVSESDYIKERVLFSNVVTIIFDIKINEEIRKYIDTHFNIPIIGDNDFKKLVDMLTGDVSNIIIHNLKQIYRDMNDVMPSAIDISDIIKEKYLQKEEYIKLIKEIFESFNDIAKKYTDHDFLSKNFISEENCYINKINN